MKIFSTILFLTIFILPTKSQLISGKIIDSSNGKPLEYVSIGVPETSIGAISDENGNFKIDVTGQPLEGTIRFSLISYDSHVYKIGELCNKENIIELKPAPAQLSDVIVKPQGDLKIVGNSEDSKYHGGWPGSEYGGGHESGLKVRLGSQPVKILDMHFNVTIQSFDTSYFRLHIRSIEKGMPSKELLKENIMFSITQSSGLVNIDLSNYNLIFKGDVAITLEWVKVIGLNEKKLYKFYDGTKRPVVLFRYSKKGAHYTKRGAENKWIKTRGIPCYYFTVQNLK